MGEATELSLCSLAVVTMLSADACWADDGPGSRPVSLFPAPSMFAFANAISREAAFQEAAAPNAPGIPETRVSSFFHLCPLPSQWPQCLEASSKGRHC